MSSKAETSSQHSHQQPQINIFFRSPLLLKIVAWLGSLSFLGSAGLVWAEIQPAATPKTDREIIQAAVSPLTGTTVEKLEDQETYGPYLPLAQKPAPVQLNLASRPKQEGPVAVAPADAVILPTGTIVRPQHSNVSNPDNQTTKVGSTGRSRDAVQPSSQQPTAVNSPAIIAQTAPRTGLLGTPQPAQSANGHRSVPVVTNIPHPVAPHFGQAGSSHPTAVATPATTAQLTKRQPLVPQVLPLAGLRNTVVAPMRPASTAQSAPVKPSAVFAKTPAPAEDSIEISVPAPRSGRVEVQAVAHLPQVSANRAVPTVPAIPSVRPAGMTNSQTPVAFVNTGETSAQLIYPLSSPAPTTSSFGWRTHPITGSRRFHSGIDIGAPMGAPVVAAGSGIVMSSGWLGGYGKAIVIQHNGVQQTLYGHLSEVFVQPGQRIEQGTVIGRVGSTGNSTGPHLHFETRAATTDGWVAVDPADDIKYALENLRQAAPFAQRDLPPGYN